MPKAYSYIRFSRPEQLRGDSLRRQREAADEWAAKNGYVIDESITDLGVSGFRGANRINGALGKFLDLVHRGRIEAGSVLIVESLDRISREAVRLVTPSFLALINAGIRVVTLTDKQEYSAERLDREPMALFGAVMVMIRANEESATKSIRVSQAWEKKRASGEVLTARVPAWLEVVTVDGRRVIREKDKRGDTVRRIFRDTIAGYGRRQVAARLKGVDAFGGGRWGPSYVAKILENRAVLGEMQPYVLNEAGVRVPAGEPRRDYYPSMVDETTFLRANASKEGRATAAGRRGAGVSNLLKGMAVCGVCKRRMTRENKGSGAKAGEPYLVCAGHRDGECRNNRHWKVERVERLVMEGAIRIDLSKALVDGGPAAPPGPTAADLELKRAELVKRRERALDLLMEDEEEGLRERYRRTIEDIRAMEVLIAARKKEERRAREGEGAEERRMRIAAIMERLDAASGDDLADLRTRLAQELRSSLKEVRFYLNEIGIVYPEGATVTKGAVLRKPAYVPVFQDGDARAEELRDADPGLPDPARAAADRTWLASLRGKRSGRNGVPGRDRDG